MRVPFPYDLSVGTDIIAHSRILRTLQTHQANPQRLINRILHPREITTLNTRFANWKTSNSSSGSEQHKLSVWLAGRWAAKEAAKKAWGAHLIGFRDLRVEQHVQGSVEIVCQSFEDGSENSENPEQIGKVSISHDGDYATATVIASSLHSDIVAALEARRVLIDRNTTWKEGSDGVDLTQR